jgi:hypothetical protein
VNRKDRELLAVMGLLNSDVVPLAMKIIADGSVTVTSEEQYAFAERLTAMWQLKERASGWSPGGMIQM